MDEGPVDSDTTTEATSSSVQGPYIPDGGLQAWLSVFGG